MSASTLALVVAVGLLGPLLSARARWRVPVVVGELLGGLLIGTSGLRLVDPAQSDFRFLATIGFGLTMVVVGSHIPVRLLRLPGGEAGRTAAAVAAVAALACVLGFGLAASAGTGHGAIYSVVLASSSAALILPMLSSVGLAAPDVRRLIVQVAAADIVCIVALPFVVAPGQTLLAAVAAGLIALLSAGLVLLLGWLSRSGLRRRLHAFSERRRFALELRLSLLTLFAFGAIAQFGGLSIMLPGFALGLVLSAVGEPHRLARQLFGMTEGFFGPLFFVWLGASLDLRELGQVPGMVLLGIALGLAAVVAHAGARVTGLPWADSVASAGQLGVPVGAVALGLQYHVLVPGEGSAILLGALITVATSAVAVGVLARRRRSPSPASQ